MAGLVAVIVVAFCFLGGARDSFEQKEKIGVRRTVEEISHPCGSLLLNQPLAISLGLACGALMRLCQWPPSIVNDIALIKLGQ
jgi:hypothetical protein